MEVWTTIILPILSGLVAAIPLVIKLVEYVQKARKEKNWGAVVQLALRLMAEAEQNYTNGEDKKNYVMSSIKAMENTLQYDIDENAISELIDAVVAATKKINTK
jgi:hypothetical protein